MTDSSSLVKIISTVKPDEIYNLAAQSHVKVKYIYQLLGMITMCKELLFNSISK